MREKFVEYIIPTRILPKNGHETIGVRYKLYFVRFRVSKYCQKMWDTFHVRGENDRTVGHGLFVLQSFDD